MSHHNIACDGRTRDRAHDAVIVQVPSCAHLRLRPGWHGPCHRGHARCVRAAKRWEAMCRERRPARDLRPACRWPHKTAYENQAAVNAALKGIKRWNKRQGLHPYHCPAGHWHLGRWTRRSLIAWKATI